MVAYFALFVALSSLVSSKLIHAEETIGGSSVQQILSQGSKDEKGSDEGENGLDAELFGVQEKRTSGFMPMRGRKMSFMPMRGKKPSGYAFDEDMKRAGFMPMRGRKSDLGDILGSNGYYLADYESGSNKRASGFLPMRGKKEQFGDSNEQDKRAAFHALRGKKTGSFLFPEASFRSAPRDGWVEVPGSNLGEKRANAFFGMRG